MTDFFSTSQKKEILIFSESLFASFKYLTFRILKEFSRKIFFFKKVTKPSAIRRNCLRAFEKKTYVSRFEGKKRGFFCI